jgi:hypothetical protein
MSRFGNAYSTFSLFQADILTSCWKITVNLSVLNVIMSFSPAICCQFDVRITLSLYEISLTLNLFLGHFCVKVTHEVKLSNSVLIPFTSHTVVFCLPHIINIKVCLEAKSWHHFDRWQLQTCYSQSKLFHIII